MYFKSHYVAWGMPNNQLPWEIPHLKCKKLVGYLVALKCHIICMCMSWSVYGYLFVSCCIACVSVESGDEVPQQQIVDPYYQQYPQFKRNPTSLCISLDLYFSLKYFTTEYCMRFQSFGKMLEYPTTCINTSNNACFPPNSHSVDVSLSKIILLSTYA